MIQYVILEELGVLSQDRPRPLLHSPADGSARIPTTAMPGIEASTGSLGHGLGMATGMAYAEKLKGTDRRTSTCVLSDGELQEGSTWEAMMMAANLELEQPRRA